MKLAPAVPFSWSKAGMLAGLSFIFWPNILGGWDIKIALSVLVAGLLGWEKP